MYLNKLLQSQTDFLHQYACFVLCLSSLSAKFNCPHFHLFLTAQTPANDGCTHGSHSHTWFFRSVSDTINFNPPKSPNYSQFTCFSCRIMAAISASLLLSWVHVNSCPISLALCSREYIVGQDQFFNSNTWFRFGRIHKETSGI